MTTWIGLMRGIGGGIRTVPMKELQTALAEIGLRNVQTYIQTGNVVFESARSSPRRLAASIDARVSQQFGFDSTTVVLSAADLQRIAKANPFRKAQSAPTTLHLFFMQDAPPAPDIGGMKRWRSSGEAFEIIENVLYLRLPDGFSTSKLAPRIERLLGVPATARNWRTVSALVDLAGAR